MSVRLGIYTSKYPTTTAAVRRFQRDRFGHQFRWHEGSLVFGVPFLFILFPAGGFAFRNRLFGMRMFAEGRQRRFFRVHPETGFQLLNSPLQAGDRFDQFQTKDLSLVWNPFPQLWRHLGHNRDVAENAISGKTYSSHSHRRGVNGSLEAPCVPETRRPGPSPLGRACSRRPRRCRSRF